MIYEFFPAYLRNRSLVEMLLIAIYATRDFFVLFTPASEKLMSRTRLGATDLISLKGGNENLPRSHIYYFGQRAAKCAFGYRADHSMQISHHAFPSVHLTPSLYNLSHRLFVNEFLCSQDLVMLTEKRKRRIFDGLKSKGSIQ